MVFNGRNCLEDGLDGFFDFTVQFLAPPSIDARTLSVRDFSAGAVGRSTALIAPEPSVLFLTGAGLLAVGVFARRRSHDSSAA